MSGMGEGVETGEGLVSTVAGGGVGSTGSVGLHAARTRHSKPNTLSTSRCLIQKDASCRFDHIGVFTASKRSNMFNYVRSMSASYFYGVQMF
jgi:hypothetical protein